jgi:hypothetical protein
MDDSNAIGLLDHKFAVVLLGKLEPGVALNAAGHLCACRVERAPPELRRKMSFVDYLDRDGGAHPVSALSLVVLQAKNVNHLRRARTEALAKGLLCTDFLETMTGGTTHEQLARTRALAEPDLLYWGLALFGLATDLDPITRRFSLWR